MVIVKNDISDDDIDDESLARETDPLLTRVNETDASTKSIIPFAFIIVIPILITIFVASAIFTVYQEHEIDKYVRSAVDVSDIKVKTLLDKKGILFANLGLQLTVNQTSKKPFFLRLLEGNMKLAPENLVLTLNGSSVANLDVRPFDIDLFRPVPKTLEINSSVSVSDSFLLNKFVQEYLKGSSNIPSDAQAVNLGVKGNFGLGMISSFLGFDYFASSNKLVVPPIDFFQEVSIEELESRDMNKSIVMQSRIRTKGLDDLWFEFDAEPEISFDIMIPSCDSEKDLTLSKLYIQGLQNYNGYTDMEFVLHIPYIDSCLVSNCSNTAMSAIQHLLLGKNHHKSITLNRNCSEDAPRIVNNILKGANLNFPPIAAYKESETYKFDFHPKLTERTSKLEIHWNDNKVYGLEVLLYSEYDFQFDCRYTFDNQFNLSESSLEASIQDSKENSTLIYMPRQSLSEPIMHINNFGRKLNLSNNGSFMHTFVNTSALRSAIERMMNETSIDILTMLNLSFQLDTEVGYLPFYHIPYERKLQICKANITNAKPVLKSYEKVSQSITTAEYSFEVDVGAAWPADILIDVPESELAIIIDGCRIGTVKLLRQERLGSSGTVYGLITISPLEWCGISGGIKAAKWLNECVQNHNQMSIEIGTTERTFIDLPNLSRDFENIQHTILLPPGICQQPKLKDSLYNLIM